MSTLICKWRYIFSKAGVTQLLIWPTRKWMIGEIRSWFTTMSTMVQSPIQLFLMDSDERTLAVIMMMVKEYVFQSMTNKTQLYSFFYFCKLLYTFRAYSPPIIWCTTLYLQNLVFVKPLLLPAAIVKSSSNDLTNTRCCRYSVVILIMGGEYARNMYNSLLK